MSESAVILPQLNWHPTPNKGDRRGHPVNLVVVHRWGVRYIDQPHEAKTYAGVVGYLSRPASKASAHIVYPGTAVHGNVATQLVGWDDYAWAEAAYNPVSDEVESADAIWLGHDAAGMRVLARIVACRLHARDLPPVWSTHKGFCRHADLGAAGGGHTSCPTTNMVTWRHFVGLVQDEYDRGGCRPWGRD